MSPAFTNIFILLMIMTLFPLISSNILLQFVKLWLTFHLFLYSLSNFLNNKIRKSFSYIFNKLRVLLHIARIPFQKLWVKSSSVSPNVLLSMTTFLSSWPNYQVMSSTIFLLKLSCIIFTFIIKISYIK